MRRLVDDDPRGDRFLLTGSASTTQTHSDAGRITMLRMRTLCLSERRPPQHDVSFRELLAGTATIEGPADLVLADHNLVEQDTPTQRPARG